MKGRKLPRVGIIFIFVLSIACVLFIAKASASSLCPTGYTDKQCYDYLNQKQNELSQKKKNIDASIKNVKYQEGDVRSQLDALNAEIQQKQIEASEKQVEMELTSIEIRNKGSDISETKTKIDTIKQEASRMSQQINDGMLLSYKITSVPSWYYLANTDLISTVEMISYVNYVVEQEKSQLNHFNQLQSELASEEQLLTNAQQEIIDKRNALEQANLDLIKIQNDLKADSSKQTALLAQLQDMEKKLDAQKTELVKEQNSYDSEATALAIKLFQSGRLGKGTPVNKGDIIGFEGHTGCAFGSHLHFGIIKGSATHISGNINPFGSGYLHLSGNYVTSGSGQVPLAGALLTQGFHEGYAIDMVSTSQGNQTGAKYFIPVGSIKCAPSYGGVYHGLRGEGAPVRAMLSGTIYRGNTDRWGSNYIIIDHGNNLLTFYFHLK